MTSRAIVNGWPIGAGNASVFVPPTPGTLPSIPSGFVFLAEPDGAYVQDETGAFLVEPV